MMSTASINHPTRLRRTAAVALCGLAGALTACSSLLPAPSPQPAFFTLQGVPGPAAARAVLAPNTQPGMAASAAVAAAPVLVVNVPSTAPGYDSTHIVYTRQPQQIEYFARHEWVDAPARMLAPLLVAALDRSGAFSAVVLAPSAAAGSLQLNTQLLRLQQDFTATPSQVRLGLRAQLIHTASRQVLATRDFEEVTTSASEDARGGVAAANLAAQAVLSELAAWCASVVAALR